MVSNKEVFKECVQLMGENGIESPLYEIKWIFMSVLQKHIFSDSEITEEQAQKIKNMTLKRCEGYPLQYILGEWDFYGYTFTLNENVLIPRPDTETLIENVIHICKENNLVSPKIVDLCSGSGCIAIVLKKEIPDSEVYAVEISETAVEVIKANADYHNANIKIINADVKDSKLAESLSDFDIIVSNPPYLTQNDMENLQKEVTYEPSLALFGGSDGLDFYREITPVWKNSLKINGWLCYEFGMGQHDDVKKILQKWNFKNIIFTRDTQNIIRTVTAQKTEE